MLHNYLFLFIFNNIQEVIERWQGPATTNEVPEVAQDAQGRLRAGQRIEKSLATHQAYSLLFAFSKQVRCNEYYKMPKVHGLFAFRNKIDYGQSCYP